MLENPGLLYLHAFCARPDSFQMLTGLKTTLPDVRISAPIFYAQNTAQSLRVDSLHSQVQLCQQALLELRQETQNITCLGHSLGGVVALLLNEKCPGLIKNLVLAAPPALLDANKLRAHALQFQGAQLLENGIKIPTKKGDFIVTPEFFESANALKFYEMLQRTGVPTTIITAKADTTLGDCAVDKNLLPPNCFHLELDADHFFRESSRDVFLANINQRILTANQAIPL